MGSFKPPFGAQLNRGHPFARGVVGGWLFNEGSGGTVHDLLGMNPGTLTNMDPDTDWVGSTHGWALDFDGTNDNVVTTLSPPYGSSVRSIVAWVSCDVEKDGKFVSQGDGASDGQAFDFTVQNISGTDYVLLRHGGGNIRFPGVTVGSWFHFVAVVPVGAVNCSDVLVYIDGIARTGTRNVGADQTLNTAQTVLNIGSRVGGSLEFFDGQIADCFSYDRALSADEIRHLYAFPYCMIETPGYEAWMKAAAAAGMKVQVAAVF